MGAGRAGELGPLLQLLDHREGNGLAVSQTQGVGSLRFTCSVPYDLDVCVCGEKGKVT